MLKKFERLSGGRCAKHEVSEVTGDTPGNRCTVAQYCIDVGWNK